MLWHGAPDLEKKIEETELAGFRVLLRPAVSSDYRSWLTLRSRNEKRLRPVEPAWPADALSQEYFARKVQSHDRDRRLDRAHCFLIFDRHSGALVGGMNLNAVIRGAAQYCSLGYWIGEEYEGQGLMTESGRLLIGHAFGALNLQRINAACLPDNTRSSALLNRLGFNEEGFARKYLQINGLWRDHVLYGLCAPGGEG